MRKEGEKEWTKLSAKALRSDTKADLLSSALPPVMAEALQPNEETVTSGRQLIARPAGKLIPEWDEFGEPQYPTRTRVCAHMWRETIDLTDVGPYVSQTLQTLQNTAK